MVSYIYSMMVILGVAFLMVLSMIFDEMRRDLGADEKVQALFDAPNSLAACDDGVRPSREAA